MIFKERKQHTCRLYYYCMILALHRLKKGWLHGVCDFCDGNYAKSFLPVPSGPEANNVVF